MLTQAGKGAAFYALHARDGAFLIPNPWEVGMHLTQVAPTDCVSLTAQLGGLGDVGVGRWPGAYCLLHEAEKQFARLLDFRRLKRNVNSSR